MWNVYQYVKDFGNDKVEYKEFIDIYNRQKVLRDYIKDSYLDVINHKLTNEYKSLGGVIFPDKYIDINDFIIHNNNVDEVKKCLKALAIIIDKIYK